MRGVIDSLVAAPATFLRRHLLLVVGSETDGAMRRCFVHEKPNMPNVPIKLAFYSAKMNEHLARSPQIDVANVPGVVWSDVPNRTRSGIAGSLAGITGTDLGDAPSMLTTQFSGCSFCYKTHLGKTFAAHIVPGAEHIKGSDLPGCAWSFYSQESRAGQVTSVVQVS